MNGLRAQTGNNTVPLKPHQKKKKILRLHSTRSKIVECHYFHFIDSGQNHNKNGLWKHSEVHKEIQLEVLEKVRMCAQDQYSFGY